MMCALLFYMLFYVLVYINGVWMLTEVSVFDTHTIILLSEYRSRAMDHVFTHTLLQTAR